MTDKPTTEVEALRAALKKAEAERDEALALLSEFFDHYLDRAREVYKKLSSHPA